MSSRLRFGRSKARSSYSLETSNTEKPYRFDTLQAADAFLSDLMTSFSYLGCDIASTT